MPQLRRAAARKPKPDKGGARTAAKKKWSQAVTGYSSALDLEASIFSKDDPKAIAASLKRSAERSRRRKSEPYRSAMSMLSFYINRAGKQLPQKRRRVLERAKVALREAFGRT